MNGLKDTLLTLTVVTTGLSAGLLAAFAYAVMPLSLIHISEPTRPY